MIWLVRMRLPWLSNPMVYGHRRTGRGAGGALPPSLVRNINYLGNFYLRVGQSSCSCFVSLIFVLFSFHLSLAPCIKTHTKTQEMALKRLYFSKFSWRACPRTLLEVLTPSARVGQIRVCPPKISKPVRLCLRLLPQVYNRPNKCSIKFYPSSTFPLIYFSNTFLSLK